MGNNIRRTYRNRYDKEEETAPGARPRARGATAALQYSSSADDAGSRPFSAGCLQRATCRSGEVRTEQGGIHQILGLHIPYFYPL